MQISKSPKSYDNKSDNSLVLQQLFLTAVICAAFILVILGSQGTVSTAPTALVILLVINGLVATIAIVMDNRIFSIGKMHWYFQLIFMSMAPLAQRLKGFYCSQYFIPDDYFLFAAAIVFVWNILFLIIYNSFGNKAAKTKRPKEISHVYLTRSFQVVLTVFAVICFIVLVMLVGFESLFVKAENTIEFESSTISFLTKKFLTAFPAMVLAAILLSREYVRPLPLVVIMLLALVILSNYPTSTTRYWMAALLGGLALIAIGKESKGRWVDFLILFGLIVVFPMLYVFKFATLDTAIINYSGILDFSTTFCSVDYDAFSMLARVVQYVDMNGFSFGKQLLGTVLFFIPRSIWPGKPFATGPMVADAQGSRFTNLSSPIEAEGYVDFGIVGVVIFAITLAWFVARLDSLYWSTDNVRNSLSLLNICYPFIALLVIYISRGALKPSFMQAIAMLIPGILIFLFAYTNHKSLVLRRRDPASNVYTFSRSING